MPDSDITPFSRPLRGILLKIGSVLVFIIMQSMIKVGGNVFGLFERPIGGTLGALTLAVWILPPLWLLWRRFARPAAW